MSDLNERSRSLLSDPNIRPNVILQIEDYDRLLTVTDVYKLLEFESDVAIPVGTVFGSKVKRDDVVKLISIDGTTSVLSAGVEPDKGGGSATSNVTVRLVDAQSFITKLITPNLVIQDLLYRRCKFWMGLESYIFPQDYNLVFNGIITSIKSRSTTIDLTISHPDDYKRTDTFDQIETKLSQIATFRSLVLGNSLLIEQRGDFVGTVTIQVLNQGGAGGSISVSGSQITIEALTGTTTYNQIKTLIDSNAQAVQLVLTKMIGERDATSTALSLQELQNAPFLEVESVEGLSLPVAPYFRTCVRIKDEIVEYTGIDQVNKRLTGLSRRLFNSFAQTHEIDSEVKSFYVLSGSVFDLWRILLLSKAPSPYEKELPVSDIVSLPNDLSASGALFVRNRFLRREIGLSSGDTITITDATESANNQSAQVTQVLEFENGTFIQTNSTTMVSESPSTAIASFESQWNVLPDGAGMIPSQVDLEQADKVLSRFSANFGEYEFFLKEGINIKDFLEQEILRPFGLYSVPRNGRVSVQYTAPAVFDRRGGALDRNNVKNPQNIEIERSSAKFFYNTALYKYQEDSIEDTFLRGFVLVSESSFNQIKANTKQLTIESKGLRIGSETLIEDTARRFLLRYRFGSEFLVVETAFRSTQDLEIGDSVLFGDESFSLPNTKTGQKRFSPQRVFEIINREINWKLATVRLTLADTAFLGRRRYGLFSPQSSLSDDSTSTRLVLRKNILPQATSKEVSKWQTYAGKDIRVRSTSNFTTSVNEVRTIVGFDFADEGSVFIQPPLSFTPTNDSLLDLAPYPEGNINRTQDFKNRYVYFTPQVAIDSVIDARTLQVANPGLFFIGSPCRVHSPDFSRDSRDIDLFVTQILGDNITLNNDVPAGTVAGDLIDLIGFSFDSGDPYAFL